MSKDKKKMNLTEALPFIRQGGIVKTEAVKEQKIFGKTQFIMQITLKELTETQLVRFDLDKSDVPEEEPTKIADWEYYPNPSIWVDNVDKRIYTPITQEEMLADLKAFWGKQKNERNAD